MKIRCFDLGGNGLKTCLVEKGDSKINATHLGKVPPSLDVADWIRSKVESLEEEIKAQTWFSFSLAGLDKLTSTKPKLVNNRDSISISKLFSLPSDRVCSLNDGDAHLVASNHQLGISLLPHMNCCVGSGVGFGIYHTDGKLLSEKDLFQALGCAPWDLITASSASNRKADFALANKGLEELKKEVGESAIGRFEKRWTKFLREKLFVKLRHSGLMPREFTFTGGVTDFHALWVAPIYVDGCFVRRGPENGGLLGAKLNAINRCP